MATHVPLTIDCVLLSREIEMIACTGSQSRWFFSGTPAGSFLEYLDLLRDPSDLHYAVQGPHHDQSAADFEHSDGCQIVLGLNNRTRQNDENALHVAGLVSMCCDERYL